MSASETAATTEAAEVQAAVADAGSGSAVEEGSVPPGESVLQSAGQRAPLAAASGSQATVSAGAASAAGSSTMLRVIVRNINKHMRPREVESALQKLGMPGVEKIEKPYTGQVAFLQFADEASRDSGLAVLNAAQIRGRQLSAVVCKQPENTGRNAKRRRGEIGAADAETAEAALKRLRGTNAADIVTSWRSRSYAQQLEDKRSDLTEILQRMKAAVKKAYRQSSVMMPGWLRGASPLCELEMMLPAPQPNGYRNKCEFTIGTDVDGKRCVGFQLGSFADGVVSIGRPHDAPNVSAPALRVVDAMQRVVDASALEPYAKKTHTGFWRQLCVRNTQAGDTLAMVQVNPTDVPQEQLTRVLDDLTTSLTRNLTPVEASFRLVGLLWQSFDGRSNAAPWGTPWHVLHGTDHLVEQMNGLAFDISPSAFFQVNTPAAEAMYDLVRRWAYERDGETVRATLVDMYCGTGTIGLIMAQGADKVIGIEEVETAVEDARANAVRNGVDNAVFVAGKAEKVLDSTLAKHAAGAKDLVVVVDPPRSGLHPNVIKALRSSGRVDRLVYVSCNPKSLVNDVAGLARPTSNSYRGDAFRATRAAGVDLFPHTPHCEMVVLFERGAALAQRIAAGSAGDAATSGAADACGVATSSGAADATGASTGAEGSSSAASVGTAAEPTSTAGATADTSAMDTSG